MGLLQQPPLLGRQIQLVALVIYRLDPLIERRIQADVVAVRRPLRRQGPIDFLQRVVGVRSVDRVEYVGHPGVQGARPVKSLQRVRERRGVRVVDYGVDL